MSRIAKNPVAIPAGIDISIEGGSVTVKGAKGQLAHTLHPLISLDVKENVMHVKWDENDKQANALAGTTRAIVNNMVTGVTQGFEKKLNLVGVGYRAQVKGKLLNLTLGFSHPVDFAIPEGIQVETPSQTEVTIKGCDKQKVGQTAAEIRAYRSPEPYKGKGVRYADEHVVRKEAKKK